MVNLLLSIIRNPAIVVALIALVGLILQKKHFTEIIKGTIKAFLGFVVLQAGANVISGSLDPFGKMFQAAFHVNGVVPNNEAIVALALSKYGTVTALILFFGLIANMLLARFTAFKNIYLSGHCAFYMACMFGIIFQTVGMNGIQLIITGALALGLYMAVFPQIAQSTMRKITGNDSVAMAHTGSLGYALSGWIGKIVGKGSKSTEELNFPKWLGFLRDSSVSISLTMVILYLIVSILSGQHFVESKLSGGTNYLVYSVTEAITFAAGVFIILSGVRLVLNEIIPAFKGISMKLVPNARPALDCPIVYPYAPNAVVLGFFCSFLGGIVGMVICALAGSTIILPGVVPHFFTGATAGVFGNARGGIRGATIGSFVNGIVITFLPLFLLPVLGNLGFANTTFSDADYGVTGIFAGNIAKSFGATGVTLSVVVLLLLTFVYSFFKKSKANDNSQQIGA